jgi:glucose-1-phosphate adenylyltransferase
VVALPDVKVNRNVRLKDVVVDRGVEIPEGMVVGEDREDDMRRFRVTENGVTLITQAMIDALES